MGRPRNAVKGKTFGRLTVVVDEDGGKNPEITCQCTCGKKVTALKHNVVRGNTTSCGCWRSERLRKSDSEKKKRVVRKAPPTKVYDWLCESDVDDDDFI